MIIDTDVSVTSTSTHFTHTRMLSLKIGIFDHPPPPPFLRSNQMDVPIYDIRFAFNYDNPFQDDQDRSKLKKLKQYLAANQSQFVGANYLEDSRYLIIRHDIQKLFNVSVYDPVTRMTRPNISNHPLINHVKSFIATVPGISSELRSWASKQSAVSDDAPVSSANDDADDTTDAGDDNSPVISDEQYDNFVSSMSHDTKTAFVALSTVTNYDISTDRSISFEDLRNLTVNIARSKLIPEAVKDETVIALEAEKRKKLIQQIKRYRNVKVIAMLDDSDLTDMNLSQLEQCLEQCRKYHENFKTLELFKRGFGTGGVVYDMVFPEGIPISKTKRLCFKGVGKEILSTLFDPTTPVGLAFSNILDKHNIHVSDELLTIVAFLGVCVSKVKIENVKPKEDDEKKPSDSVSYVRTNQLSGAVIDDEYTDDLEEVSEEEA